MEAAANEEFDLKVELDAQRLAEDTTPAGPEVVAARRTLREAEIELRKHQDGKEAIEAIGLDPQLAAPALSAAEAKITTAKTEVDAAAAALAELEADAVATQVAADIPSVAHALALLAEERTVSPRLREILSRIIDLLVLRPDPTTGKIHGEVSLRLNDSTGIARVTTPAMFTVKGSRRGYIEQTDDDGKTFVRRDRQSRIEHPNQLIGHLLSDARTSPQDKAERRRSALSCGLVLASDSRWPMSWFGCSIRDWRSRRTKVLPSSSVCSMYPLRDPLTVNMAGVVTRAMPVLSLRRRETSPWILPVVGSGRSTSRSMMRERISRSRGDTVRSSASSARACATDGISAATCVATASASSSASAAAAASTSVFAVVILASAALRAGAAS